MTEIVAYKSNNKILLCLTENKYTWLFEMIVGVLTNCHTQYT